MVDLNSVVSSAGVKLRRRLRRCAAAGELSDSDVCKGVACQTDGAFRHAERNECAQEPEVCAHRLSRELVVVDEMVAEPSGIGWRDFIHGEGAAHGFEAPDGRLRFPYGLGRRGMVVHPFRDKGEQRRRRLGGRRNRRQRRGLAARKRDLCAGGLDVLCEQREQQAAPEFGVHRPPLPSAASSTSAVSAMSSVSLKARASRACASAPVSSPGAARARRHPSRGATRRRSPER